MTLSERIELTMGFHPGNSTVAPLYEALRNEFRSLAHKINLNCPDGLCKDEAVKYLELALMRAIQSIAVTQPLGPERLRSS